MASKADNTNEDEKVDAGSEKDVLETIGNSKKQKGDTTEPVDGNKCLKYTWTQTEQDVQISLDVGRPLRDHEIKEMEFREDDVSVVLADERYWKCKFNKPIVASKSRVLFKTGDMILLVRKKQDNQKWASLEARVPVENSEGRSVDEGSPEKENTFLEQDIVRKEDEPVLEINHAKHQFFEKDKLMTVTIFVKEINKDSLKVIFKEKMVAIKFQTSDQKFLALNKVTDQDTVFLWQIQLKHEIIPVQSKHKLGSQKVELILMKQLAVRWCALEAPTIRETQSAPALNKWTAVSPPSVPPPPPPPVNNQSGVKFKLSNQSASGSTNKTESLSSSIKARSRAMFGNDSSSSDDEQPSTSRGVRDSNILTERNSRKPTCMVSPLDKAKNSRVVVAPGMTGLDNLGNTCFMNATLQVLANTKIFREYFLDSHFQKDINADNPLGSGGQLAVAFAVLLKTLWAGCQYSCAPSKLKNLVALKNSQFTGFAQHDAQEFLAFLLDGLHEDLNRIKKKPYMEAKDADGRPDEVVAQEQWEQYKMRNDSFIVDLFQGQYKSTLVCPVCSKVSITFDPYMYLSVPLPKKKMYIQVYFVSKELHKKPVRYFICLHRDSRGIDLKRVMSQKTGIPVKNLRAFEAYKSKYHRFIENSSDLSAVSSSDLIFVNEVLSEELAGEEVIEINVCQRTIIPSVYPTKCSNCRRTCSSTEKLKRCTKCYKVGYCDQQCQRDHWQSHKTLCRELPEPVGQPFIISLPRSKASYSRIAQALQAFSVYSVDIFQPPVSKDSNMSISSSESSLCSTSLLEEASKASLFPECKIHVQEPSPSSSEVELKIDLDSQNSNSSVGDDVEFPITLRKGDKPCTITKPDSDGGDDDSMAGVEAGDSTSLNDSNVDMTDSASQSRNIISLEQNLNCSSDNSGGDAISNKNDSINEKSEEKKIVADLTIKENVGDSEKKSRNLEDTSEIKFNRCDDHSEKIQSNNGATIPHKIALPQVEPMKTLNFFMKPVSQHGTGLPAPEGTRLQDKDDEPLGLPPRSFLAMDWKNNERNKTYVLVQTKELEYVDEVDSNIYNENENKETTLQQCLQLFTEPEILNPEEAWYCPRCKKHVEASKQMSIWRLPDTLTIHLKRFSFRNFIWRDKIDRFVDYPVWGLDMSQFFVGPNHGGPPIYDLYGIINHHGGILGGHYTSYSRLADSKDWKKNEVDWRLFDDARVSHANINNVITRSAYVLFYRRRKIDTLMPKEISMEAAEKNTDSNSEQYSSDEDANAAEQNVHPGELSRPTVVMSPSLSASPEMCAGGDAPVLLAHRASEQADNRLNYESYTDMDCVD